MENLSQTLKQHKKTMESVKISDLFLQHSKRAELYSLDAPNLFLDYSKNIITEETLEHLFDLANNSHLKDKIHAMFNGDKINTTEDRPVLHVALRNRSNRPILVDGEDVMPLVNTTLNKMRHFVNDIHTDKWKGYTGMKITDIVNIGIGGSDLGPKMVAHALAYYKTENIEAHFVSNIDGTQIVETLKKLNPATTLFIVASKTFSTIETLTNANTAKEWLIENLGSEDAVPKHFIALSSHEQRVKEFGIDPKNMFEFWDWVGGRYSVWSAIGLSVALLIGMEQFEEFLMGAFEMDEHFRTAPLHKNAPVLLALIGIWYRDFFNYQSYAVLPYNQYLELFTKYLQQLDMESNGKSTQINGEMVTHNTGPILWGGIGTDGQHAFHQLLHQGTTVVPIDFIIPKKSLNPVGQHHELLFANCLAQSEALLNGKTEEAAFNELIAAGMERHDAKKLAPHKVMPGNRPSNTILLHKLTPRTLGSLIALYEHKVFVQGIIWDINSFDQWGVELGKQLANVITPELSQMDKPNHDGSTNQLIEKYREQLFVID